MESLEVELGGGELQRRRWKPEEGSNQRQPGERWPKNNGLFISFFYLIYSILIILVLFLFFFF